MARAKARDEAAKWVGPARQPDERMRWVHARLVELWGDPQWEPSSDALGELVATILSQHTSDVNSARAYERLRLAFPDWAAARDAPREAIAEAIRVGGLAEMKAERIQRVLREVSAARGGALDLGYLSALTLDDARAALLALLFALGKPAFPVDTHVYRVTRRLGMIGPKVTADAAHVILEEQIPPEWRYTMHVDLIQHGRRVCHAQRPDCERCALRARCQYYWATREHAERCGECAELGVLQPST